MKTYLLFISMFSDGFSVFYDGFVRESADNFMVNNILIEVLGTIAQQERETTHQRQAEGIKAAKAKGKKLGRPALAYPDNWNEVYSSWKSGEITAKVAMEKTNTKRTSFYKLVQMTEAE